MLFSTLSQVIFLCLVVLGSLVSFMRALVCEELARWLCNTAVLVYYSIVTASYRMLGVGAWVTLGLGLFMRRVR